MSGDLATILAEATAALRKPAGDSPLYASREAILENLETFIPRVHDTWKKLHSKAIEEILVFDYAFLEDKKNPIKGPFREFAHYIRQLWRKINDSIVWLAAREQRHFIKRLCLYRRRGLLTECNPDSVLEQLGRMNADPFTIAIWNDATSCIDIGDISSFRFADGPWHFTEVKGGTVNEKVAGLMGRMHHSSFSDELDHFASSYGMKGLDQAVRYAKQAILAEQALGILRDEEGIEPVTSERINVLTLTVLDEFYDDQLGHLIDRAMSKGSAETTLIDDCLHIHVDGRRSADRMSVIRAFHDQLNSRNSYYSTHSRNRIRNCDLGGIASLNNNLMMPIAKPLYIRSLTPEQVGQIAIGDLMNRVHFFLDMDAFGELLSQEGARFSWSTRKEARRLCAKPPDKRHSVVHFGRIPQYEVEGVTGPITDSNLSRVLFDGLTPRVMAKQLVESSVQFGKLHEKPSNIT